SIEHQAELQNTGLRLQEDSGKLATEITQLRLDLAAVKEDIRSNGGGRLAAIEAEAARLGEESRSQRVRFEKYAEAAADLGLQAPADRVQFDANRARLADVERELAASADEVQDSRTELTMTRTVLTGRAADIAAELTSLQARPNLLPRPQVELRRRLCDGTGIQESDLPYAGELLRVRDGEAAWEGAAERTLRGFALSLLVPSEHYAAVSGWVDGNNLRGRLVYLKIGETYAPKPAETGTLAAKIAIKQGTPFRNFLLDELSSRFDYFCCDTLEDFRRRSKALTANGQLKGGRGRHEKDDRQDLSDRRNYVLGWDNLDKISRFRAEQDEVQGQLSVVAGQLSRVNDSLGAIGRQNQQLGIVGAVSDFAELSWQLTARRIEELKAEKAQLESTSDVLRQLTAKEAELSGKLERLQVRADDVQRRIGSNEGAAKDI
ncbi:MAG TPA: hypothetical protein DEP82_16045, partial [Arthrobacter bacterium]|nr:hypothetical protein [Arthrobacter sp.]